MGVFTRYFSKWRTRDTVNKTWQDYHACFTKYDKDCKENMMTEEANYSVNQVQEMIQKGVQNKIVLWYQSIQQNENINPNITPKVPLLQSSNANSLTDIDLQQLIAILQANGIPNSRMKTPYIPKSARKFHKESTPKGTL